MRTEAGQGPDLTLTEAAALAGVSEKAIRNWAKAGRLQKHGDDVLPAVEQPRPMAYPATVAATPPTWRPAARR